MVAEAIDTSVFDRAAKTRAGTKSCTLSRDKVSMLSPGNRLSTYAPRAIKTKVGTTALKAV
jgi:hypothetical protein